VVVVGDVVRLRPLLGWWEAGPLFGRRIVVTRAREQASALADRLEALGADVLSVPTIALRERLDDPQVRDAVRHLADYDWIVLTSANGVRMLVTGMQRWGVDARALGGTRIAAIGPETARALTDRLLMAPDVLASDHRAEGLVAALGSEVVGGRRILLPRAAGSRSVLPEALRARGAIVDDVALYEATVPDGADVADVRAALAEHGVDALTFTSSSTVRNFVALLGADAAELVAASGARVACIGPVTAETAAGLGLRVEVQPTTFTVPALVEALVAHFRMLGEDAGRENAEAP
jgi:uroporphyrinogen III methyltransferase / synthase